MADFLDILNEEGKVIGSKSSDEIHRDGLLHRTAHVWLLNSKQELLIQKRSSNKTAYPNCWDISASGHLAAGEVSLEGAQRETMEEIGLDFPATAFKLLFTLRDRLSINGGTYNVNEFQDVYLVKTDKYISEMKAAPDEVSELRWIGVKEFKEWVKSARGDVVPHAEEYQKLFDYLDSK
jgi:isopentenyl-diphosphate Delta-isomerase